MYRKPRWLYNNLYHAIEITGNKSTGKPLFVPQYYSQPVHLAPRVRSIDCAGHCIVYGMV